jgi:drug/metabolite transporter (DMT)-like permease
LKERRWCGTVAALFMHAHILVQGHRRRRECNILHYVVNKLRANPKALAFVLLLVVTGAWGSTFVVVKGATAHSPVMNFLAWRFIVGGGLLALIRPGALVRLGRRGWSHGILLGLALAGGYALQTYGLRYTSAAISGFLTGLQVVFTPLLAWALLRYRPTTRAWVATGLATAGLAVISLHGFSFGLGEVLTIACAILFAGQIVGLGHWSLPEDAYGLATVQLLTVAAVCSAASLPSGLHPPASAGDWAAVVVTAVVATAFAFVVQSWAQSHLSTTRTAIVLTMEPVFAAATAWRVGEKLGWPVVAGGALVVVAMLVVEVAGWSRLLLPRRSVPPAKRPAGPLHGDGPSVSATMATRPVAAAPVAASSRL